MFLRKFIFGGLYMEIKYLADCPELIRTIACLQQMEMYKIPMNRNFSKAIEKFQIRSESRDKLPLTLVAFLDTLPVGSISILENELETHLNFSPWIATLFVSSHYRNRGIGKRLLVEAEKVITRLGHREVYLFTDDASNYYERLNWKKIETVHPVGKPISVIMKKTI